jgi:hypothetical protein
MRKFTDFLNEKKEYLAHLGFLEISQDSKTTTLYYGGNMGNRIAQVQDLFDRLTYKGAFKKLQKMPSAVESGSPDYAWTLKVSNKDFLSVAKTTNLMSRSNLERDKMISSGAEKYSIESIDENLFYAGLVNSGGNLGMKIGMALATSSARGKFDPFATKSFHFDPNEEGYDKKKKIEVKAQARKSPSKKKVESISEDEKSLAAKKQAILAKKAEAYRAREAKRVAMKAKEADSEVKKKVPAKKVTEGEGTDRRMKIFNKMFGTDYKSPAEYLSIHAKKEVNKKRKDHFGDIYDLASDKPVYDKKGKRLPSAQDMMKSFLNK